MAAEPGGVTAQHPHPPKKDWDIRNEYVFRADFQSCNSNIIIAHHDTSNSYYVLPFS